MSLALFLIFRHATATVDQADLAQISPMIADLPGIAAALLMTPAATNDPYLDDGRPPPLVLHLDFTAIEPLEATLRGPAQALAAGLPSLAGADITEQAMLTRRFPVPAPAAGACTYLVSYEGEAADGNEWLSHYIAHHPPIMARFPAIRAIEIYTRIDWCSATGWARETALQRNKVVFDDPAGLTTALNSPIRHEMRADFARFPPFHGRNTHYPMHTTAILPADRA